MKPKPTYTPGFERLWKVYKNGLKDKNIHGELGTKSEAYKVWVKDKLEADVNTLIPILQRQFKEKKWIKHKEGFASAMPHCRTWLNQGQYNSEAVYMGQPSKPKPIFTPDTFTPLTPEKRAELKSKLNKVTGKTRIHKERTESEIMEKKNEDIRRMLK